MHSVAGPEIVETVAETKHGSGLMARHERFEPIKRRTAVIRREKRPHRPVGRTFLEMEIRDDEQLPFGPN